MILVRSSFYLIVNFRTCSPVIVGRDSFFFSAHLSQHSLLWLEMRRRTLISRRDSGFPLSSEPFSRIFIWRHFFIVPDTGNGRWFSCIYSSSGGRTRHTAGSTNWKATATIGEKDSSARSKLIGLFFLTRSRDRSEIERQRQNCVQTDV